jgi:hypothetical protein
MGGPMFTFDDARTVSELYAAFANVRRTGAALAGGHMYDYLEFSFVSEDGKQGTGAVYESSGNSIDDRGELYEVTGYDKLFEAAARALWRKGRALFADESPIEALRSPSARRTREEAARIESALTEIEGTWVCQASESDVSFEMYTFTFHGDGIADVDEVLSGGKRNEWTLAYGFEEKNLMVFKPLGEGSGKAPFPFAMSGGQLRLTIGEDTLVFERKD